MDNALEKDSLQPSRKALNPADMARAWSRFCLQLSGHVDNLATSLLHSEKNRMGRERKSYGSRLSRLKISSPEDEVKKLLTGAASLEDVWQFFRRRLRQGSPPDLICFSVRDERGDFISLRFMDAGIDGEVDVNQAPLLAMADSANHLVQAYHRKDTTFSPVLSSLGEEILSVLPWCEDELQSPFNLFSVPMIAGGESIAMLTLGFREMDSFSQAKLSYVYTLRDQIAQLVWNLVLQDRMKHQSQIDNLTGLLSYTCFQGVLNLEITRADAQASSLGVMIIDVNNIQAINETQGHVAGDEAICHVASTVRRLIRGLDTVARYGGDEVVVLLPETAPQAADEIAQRFLEGLKVRLPEHLRTLSVSIGHACYPDDTKSRDKLLKMAEQALHLAKFKGSKTNESTCIASSEIDQLNDKTVIEVFASQVAKKYDNIHVPSVYQELQNHIEKKTPAGGLRTTEDMMLETITSLSGALEAKDRYTRGHSQAVSNYAVALAHALKMSPSEVEEIRAAAFLHDIGKIGIPESILCKTGPLNEKEWEIMKQHPVIGAQQILYPVKSLRAIIPAVECHHECWDGSGHPHGFKGERIPLQARVISVVDAFHALTSERSYRRALSVAEARKILEAGSGTKWDPKLLEIFFGILTIASPRTPEAAASSPASIVRTELSGLAAGPVQLKLETAS